MLPPTVSNLAARYPWSSSILVLIFVTGPQWLSAVWSLLSNEPLAYRLAEGLNVRLPEWSPYWVTVPLGLGMLLYLGYLRRKGAQGPTPHQLFFLSVERFISDPDARWKILVLLLLFMGIYLSLLQQRVRHLEVEMVRYVLPRQLTNEQIGAFGKYLAANSQPHEVRIRYILGNGEAQRYAEDFASAFKAGNWLPNMMPVNPSAITCSISPQGSTAPISCSSELQQMINNMEGVTIQQTGPNPPQPSTIQERLHPPPYLNQVVSDALRSAGLRGIGSGYGYSNDPLNTITVFVGSRKRDKFAVPPTKFFDHAMKDSLQNLSNDDF